MLNVLMACARDVHPTHRVAPSATMRPAPMHEDERCGETKGPDTMLYQVGGLHGMGRRSWLDVQKTYSWTLDASVPGARTPGKLAMSAASSLIKLPRSNL